MTVRSAYTIRYRNRHREKVNAWRRLNYARKVGKAEAAPPRDLGEHRLHPSQRRAFIDWVKDVPCLDCGVSYPSAVMDFDHVRGVKLFSIGATKFHFMDRIVNEMRKCDVVCSNCHRLRTWKRRPELSMAYARNGGRQAIRRKLGRPIL